MEITIKMTRRDNGSYRITVDGDGFASASSCPSYSEALTHFEKTLEIIEDRAGGGSGWLE